MLTFLPLQKQLAHQNLTVYNLLVCFVSRGGTRMNRRNVNRTSSLNDLFYMGTFLLKNINQKKERAFLSI